MKVELKTLLIIVLFSFKVGFAQEPERDNINKVLHNFAVATEAGDYVEVLNITYPGYFNYLSKKTLMAQMETMSGDTANTKITITNIQFSDFDEIVYLDCCAFVAVPFNYKMKIEFRNELIDENWIDYSAEILKVKYENPVEISYDEKWIIATVTSKILVIKNSISPNWTVIEADGSRMNILEKFLPNDIVQAIQ